MFSTDADYILHLLCGLRKDDDVRRLRRHIGRRVTMLFADSLTGLRTLTETLLENTHCCGNTVLIACKRDNIFKRHRSFSEIHSQTAGNANATGSCPRCSATARITRLWSSRCGSPDTITAPITPAPATRIGNPPPASA